MGPRCIDITPIAGRAVGPPTASATPVLWFSEQSSSMESIKQPPVSHALNQTLPNYYISLSLPYSSGIVTQRESR
jgi:hypothetical protein